MPNDNYPPLHIARILAAGVPCRTCEGKMLVATVNEFQNPMDGMRSCPNCNGTGKRCFPQDQWPQMVWARWLGSGFSLEYRSFLEPSGTVLLLDSRKTTLWYAAPPIITNDGGGWLQWLAKALDVIVEWYGGRQWRAYYADGASGHADSPLALGEAMLRRAGLLTEEVEA